jgi:hypothetical protein
VRGSEALRALNIGYHMDGTVYGSSTGKSGFHLVPNPTPSGPGLRAQVRVNAHYGRCGPSARFQT